MCLIDLSDSGCFTTSFAEQWRGSLGRKAPRKEVRTDVFHGVSALSGAERPSVRASRAALGIDPVANTGEVVFAEGLLLAGGEVLEVDLAGGLN